MGKTTEIQVRFNDLDAYGHVNNAVYLSYLEVARIDFLQEIFKRDMKKNIRYLLISVNLQYLQQITLDDKVLIDTTIDEIGKVRFSVSYKVHDGAGKVFATGSTEHVLVDGAKHRPMRLSDEWKAAITNI